MRLVHIFEMRDGLISKEIGYEMWRKQTRRHYWRKLKTAIRPPPVIPAEQESRFLRPPSNVSSQQTV